MTLNIEMQNYLKNINKDYQLAFETGTHIGDGARILSKIFKNVITCEPDLNYCKISVNNIKEKNVKILLEKSETMLAKLEEYFWEFDIKAAFYYLDAHWSAGPSGKDYGKIEQCPLIKELELITKIEHKYFIVIDDYDLFYPDRKLDNIYDENHWPTYKQILNFNNKNNHLYEIFEEKQPRYLVVTNEKENLNILNLFQKINFIEQ